MTGASIETTLELWASSLRDVKARMRGLFTQERVASSANLFLDGLLGDERRKTGWMRAEAAGDPGPWRQQAILGRGCWDAEGLRDIVRDYVVETLAADDAVLVIDETGFLKQGPSLLKRLGILRCRTSVYRLGRQDNELPDRRVRHVCVGARPCLCRPGFVLAQELVRQSCAACCGPCARSCSLRHQAGARGSHDTACADRRSAILLGRGGRGVWRRRCRTGPPPSLQRLCSRG